MSVSIDNFYAFKFLSLLVTRAKDTAAFKLGIVDEDGRQIMDDQTILNLGYRNEYTKLDKLAFNLRRKIKNSMSSGSSLLSSMTAALMLLREGKEDGDITVLEESFTKIPPRWADAEFAKEFLESYLIQEEIANSTGESVSSGTPVYKGKRIRTFHLNTRDFNQFKGVKDVEDHVKGHPSNMAVILHGGCCKIVRYGKDWKEFDVPTFVRRND